jgi:hypothetical protein
VHVRIVHVLRNREDITVVAVDSFTQLLNTEAVPQLGCLISLFLLQVYIVAEILIGVGLEVGEVGYVVIVLEGVAEGQRIQVGALRLFILVNVAGDVVLVIFVIRL